MGADGGSIPRRVELVKVKPKEEKADALELGRIRWTCCALSREDPLRPPVVTCALGLLYNKDAVIRHLIEKTMPKPFKHIRSLKDVMTVNLKPNPRYNPNGEKDHHSVNLTDWAEEAPFICPITNIEVGGNHKFSALKTCGCAFSDRALRECPSEVCLVCNTPFTPEDVLPLNPDDEELTELRLKLKERLEREKREKREKKEREREQREREREEGATKEVTFAESKPKAKKRKADPNAMKRQVSGSTDISLKKPKKALPAPANATPEIYASLFTSSIKEPGVQESFVCRNVTRG